VALTTAAHGPRHLPRPEPTPTSANPYEQCPTTRTTTTYVICPGPSVIRLKKGALRAALLSESKCVFAPMCAWPNSGMIRSDEKEDAGEQGRDGIKMTMRRHVSAVIVAGPGRFRDSLRALLTATPQIDTVNQADDAESALKAIAEEHAILMLLDGSLPGDEVGKVLRGIRVERPQVRCIVLADNARQQREAKVAGADAVLLKGFPTAELFQTVERLLIGEEGTSLTHKEAVVEGT
jgi:CheY-like chemotaxis protein